MGQDENLQRLDIINIRMGGVSGDQRRSPVGSKFQLKIFSPSKRNSICKVSKPRKNLIWGGSEINMTAPQSSQE